MADTRSFFNGTVCLFLFPFVAILMFLFGGLVLDPFLAAYPSGPDAPWESSHFYQETTAKGDYLVTINFYYLICYGIAFLGPGLYIQSIMKKDVSGSEAYHGGFG